MTNRYEMPKEPDVKKLKDKNGNIWIRNYNPGEFHWKSAYNSLTSYTWGEILFRHGPLEEVEEKFDVIKITPNYEDYAVAQGNLEHCTEYLKDRLNSFTHNEVTNAYPTVYLESNELQINNGVIYKIVSQDESKSENS